MCASYIAHVCIVLIFAYFARVADVLCIVFAYRFYVSCISGGESGDQVNICIFTHASTGRAVRVSLSQPST